jgi:polar amino acid transport system permease protein
MASTPKTAAVRIPAPETGGDGSSGNSRWDVRHAVQRKRVWGPLTVIVFAVLVAMAAHLLVTSPNLQWKTYREYIFARPIMHGVLTAMILTCICMAIGAVLGTVLALARLSRNRVLVGAVSLYIWIFRGTPQLVQLIVWFNLAALLPTVSLGIPFGPSFVSWDTITIISVYTAAVLGLSLSEAAYMAEIIRAGLLSVGTGQREASKALGFGAWHSFWRVVLPQAMRYIIPPTGSQFISLFKGTSLVSVIGLSDLLYSTQVIYSTNFRPIPLLTVACTWYLAITSILYFLQTRLEAGYANRRKSTRPRAQGEVKILEYRHVA